MPAITSTPRSAANINFLSKLIRINPRKSAVTHCHRRFGQRLLMYRKNPCGCLRELASEQIAEIVCSDEQRLIIQAAIEVQPAPFNSILHQRQTQAPM